MRWAPHSPRSPLPGDSVLGCTRNRNTSLLTLLEQMVPSECTPRGVALCRHCVSHRWTPSRGVGQACPVHPAPKPNTTRGCGHHPLPLPPRGPHVLEEQPPSTHTGLHVPTCQGVSYLWPWKPGTGTGSSHRLPAPGRSPCHPHLSRPAGPSLAPVPRLPSLPTAQGLRLRDAGWAGFSHRGCSSGETEGQRCDAVAEGGVTPSGDR